MAPTVICAVTAHEPEVEATVGLAADLAARRAAVLTVVDVGWAGDPIGAAATAPGVPVTVLEAHAREVEAALAHESADRRGRLERIARAAGLDDVVSESVAAPPARAVRALSERPEAELVVVHDHGGGALRSKLTGNPGREAMRDACCPVVLTPPGRGGPLPAAPTIMCAVDDDDLAPTVVAFAAHLATALDVPVHVVHAGDEDLLAPMLFERLVARCRAALPDGAVATFSSLPAPVAEVLREEAAGMAADLVVVGRPGHGAVASALAGSVAHDLVERGPAPVVVVPDALHLAA